MQLRGCIVIYTNSKANGCIAICYRAIIYVLLATVSIAVTALGGERPEGSGNWDKARWQQALLEERATREAKMASSSTSMLAAVAQVGYFGSELVYFDAAPSGFSYAETQSSDSKVRMMLSGDHWEWQPLDATVSATFRGKPAEPGALRPGMRFDIAGRYTYVIWTVLAGDLQMAVFDDQRLAQKIFTGLVQYPPDERYRVAATFERFEEFRKVKITTTISGTRDYFRYGEIRFTIDGQPQRLTAFKEYLDNQELFIPFRDATSGDTTYGAGRMLFSDEPAAAEFFLDFNRARNLPCVYAPEFHCPIPPRENWLQVAVAAGEQIYPLPD